MRVNTTGTTSLLDARFDFSGDEPVELDTWSTVSRQHYIDTGRYLSVGDARALEIDPWAGEPLTERP